MAKEYLFSIINLSAFSNMSSIDSPYALREIPPIVNEIIKKSTDLILI